MCKFQFETYQFKSKVRSPYLKKKEIKVKFFKKIQRKSFEAFSSKLTDPKPKRDKTSPKLVRNYQNYPVPF